MKKKALRDLSPGDTFRFLGKDRRVWKLLVKYTPNRITARSEKGEFREFHDGGLPVVPVAEKEKKKEKDRKEVRKNEPLVISKVTAKYNPHLYEGLYIMVVIATSSILAIIAFCIFMGH